MENAIHVGNKVDKDTADNLKGIIDVIFTKGHESHMDQETIQAALRMVGSVTEVKNVTITGSTFTGDKIVNMAEE